MENIDASWIQKGELGLAFAVVILAAWLVIYVVKTSKEREDKLMVMIMTFQPLIQGVADQLGSFHPVMREVLEKVGDVDNRLVVIEQSLNKPAAKNGKSGQRKRKADVNGNEREYKPE